MSMSPSIHVVGNINLTKGSGKFMHVTPGSAPLTSLSTPLIGKTFTIQTVDTAGTPLSRFQVPFRLSACLGPGEDETGSVDVVIPNDPNIGGLVLLDGATEMDRYAPGVVPTKPKNVQAGGAQFGLLPGAAPKADPVITWEDDTLGGPLPPGSKPPTYLVQISTDSGKSWTTVGLGLQKPEVSVDRQLLSNASEVQVRVTATNGFRSESTTQSFSTKDL